MSEAAVRTVPEYQRYLPKRRLAVLIGGMIGLILVGLDATIVNVAIPTMMGNLGSTMDQITWVSTGYMLANVIFLPLTGWLEARFGRRKVLTASACLFTVASLLCGTASSLGILVFYRVLQGMGGAALMSTALATMMDIYPPEKTAVISGVFGVGAMVGPALGPIVGGYLVDTHSWPFIFFVNVVPGTIASIILWTAMLEPQAAHKVDRPIDVLGIIYLSLWLGCMQVMLADGERNGWLDSNYIRFLTISSFIGMVLFLCRSLTTRHPIVNLHVLKNRALAAGCTCSFMLGLGLYSMAFVLPVFFQSVRGYTAQQSGVIMLTWAMTSAVAMMVYGQIAIRVSARKFVALGAILCAGSMYAMGSITLVTGPEHVFWPLAVFGVGVGLLMTVTLNASLSGLTGTELGDGSGLYNMLRTLGGTIGIAMISTILTKRTHFHTNMITEHVTIYNPEAVHRFTLFQQFFMSKGSSVDVAMKQSLAAMNQIMFGQATIMSFEDLFRIIALSFALIVPLVLLLRDPKPGEAKAQVNMH